MSTMLGAPFFKRLNRAIAALMLSASLSSYAAAQGQGQDLTKLKIEDLMQLEVTSVSKSEQTLSRTAAAVFVITRADIQRSGTNKIPELLRMVPGLDVAQLNSNAWAISARGFNERFGNELLVMVDGRTVYNPTFGGVFWETLDMPIEDIERIEVIRGPGGSTWGANAVNGIINVITRKASDTQGISVTASAGNVHQESGTVQFGGNTGKRTAYRIYTRYLNESSLQDSNPTLGDGWHTLRAGFRSDTTLSQKDSLTFAGDIYNGREGLPISRLPTLTASSVVPVQSFATLNGGFLQGTWEHELSSRSETALTFSYDHFERGDDLNEVRDTLDVAFQHNLKVGARHELVWGLGVRYSSSESAGDLTVSLSPADRSYNLYSAFVQDEIALLPSRLYFTPGLKIEDHYYAGLVAMPSARLAWLLNPKSTAWAAVSRAMRTPADTDLDLRVNFGSFPGQGGVPVLLASVGNPNYRAETLLGYEAGYRATLTRNVSVDLATYFNRYAHQTTVEPEPPSFEPSPLPAHLLLPLTRKNLMYGETHGFEFFADWKATDHWTLSPGYAFERIHMHLNPGSQDAGAASGAEGSSPAHAAQFRSHYALPKSVSWDVTAYFVGRLTDQEIPSYTRLDTQWSWHASERLTISAVGQNLLRSRHMEFTDPQADVRSNALRRGGFLKLSWNF